VRKVRSSLVPSKIPLFPLINGCIHVHIVLCWGILCGLMCLQQDCEWDLGEPFLMVIGHN
jgi:hypothetical protein